MKKLLFITEYTHNGKLHGSEVYAESWEAAEYILKSKKETEKIIGYVPDETKEI